MAILPTTGITTSMVASAAGVASNDVGTLFTSPYVNEYGFNCPDTITQNVIWGMAAGDRELLNTEASEITHIGWKRGYKLGAFRGYDHNWKVYSLDTMSMTGEEYYSPLTIGINIEAAIPKLVGLPEPTPQIAFNFKIAFARQINDFGTYRETILYDTPTPFVVTYPSNTFTINAETPPDYATNGALAQNQTFYIKATLLAPPDKRWIDGTYGVSNPDNFVVPYTSYTEVKSLQNESAIAAETGGVNMYKVLTELWADVHANTQISVSAQMSKNSDFSNPAHTVTLNNVNVDKNVTNIGTTVKISDLEFNFTTVGIDQDVVAGNTVYYRVRIGSNTWNTAKSIVVSNQLPT